MDEPNRDNVLLGLHERFGMMAGRVDSIEARQAQHELFFREFSQRVDKKLDEIMDRISRETGQKAAMLAIVNGCLIITSPIFAWLMIHFIGLRL